MTIRIVCNEDKQSRFESTQRTLHSKDRLTSFTALVLLNDTWLLVDLGSKLLLGHRLALGVLVLHSSLGHSDTDAE